MSKVSELNRVSELYDKACLPQTFFFEKKRSFWKKVTCAFCGNKYRFGVKYLMGDNVLCQKCFGSLVDKQDLMQMVMFLIEKAKSIDDSNNLFFGRAGECSFCGEDNGQVGFMFFMINKKLAGMVCCNGCAKTIEKDEQFVNAGFKFLNRESINYAVADNEASICNIYPKG